MRKQEPFYHQLHQRSLLRNVQFLLAHPVLHIFNEKRAMKHITSICKCECTGCVCVHSFHVTINRDNLQHLTSAVASGFGASHVIVVIFSIYTHDKS